MKIAIIRKKYNPYGGAERYLQGLIRQLTEEGHEIHIYANIWPLHETDKISFHKVPMIGALSILKVWSFTIATWFMMRKESFDIIFGNERVLIQDVYRVADGCHKGWLSVRLKHLGFWRRMSVRLNPLHLSILLLDWLIFTKNRSQILIALSRQGKQEIIRLYNVSPDNIHVIYNGVDLQRFHPRNKQYRDEVRKELGISTKDNLLLFVGTGFERKGLKFLITALPHLKDQDIRLCVVGRGNTSSYRKLARHLGVEELVYFPGAVDGAEKYYGAADILVFPTLYEPFGNVHLEALATGLPVITSSLSGGSEIITPGGDGAVIEDPANPLEIAEKVRDVIKRMNEIDMGMEARKKAEYFTLERTVNELTYIFSKITNK